MLHNNPPYTQSPQHILRKISIITLCIGLAACQSLATTPSTITSQPASNQTANDQIAFAISGKIGITSIKDGQTQAGSAFYAWGQQGDRFAIDLTGALGLGATSIRYDGQTATLISDKTGELTAATPEELLYRATGWQAPISYLPYWIIGQTAPNDTDSLYATDKLIATTNDDWTAHFDYENSNTPTRLRIQHADGHRVVMTIIQQ